MAQHTCMLCKPFFARVRALCMCICVIVCSMMVYVCICHVHSRIVYVDLCVTWFARTQRIRQTQTKSQSQQQRPIGTVTDYSKPTAIAMVTCARALLVCLSRPPAPLPLSLPPCSPTPLAFRLPPTLSLSISPSHVRGAREPWRPARARLLCG